jgi:hypothetical protein
MVRFSFFVFVSLFCFHAFSQIYEVSLSNPDSEILKTIGALDVLGAGIKDDKIFYHIHANPNEIMQLPAYIDLKQVFFQSSVEPSYSTLEEIDIRIEQLAADNKGYAAVFKIGDSVEEKNIKALRISAIESPDENTPEILFVGLHHAREWISYEVPLSIAEFLVEYADSNDTVSHILNSSVLWFIPALNPDGYLYSYETDRLWRNNRRENPDGSFGVDLNRNYDSQWIEIEYYHGTEPFSEPETRAVRDFILNGKKYGSSSIDGLLTYHSYGQMILYPPGSNFDPPENLELYQSVGNNMSNLILNECGKIYNTMQIKDLYLTFGEMTEWFMDVSGNKLSYTFELRPAFSENYGFELPDEFIKDTVKENIPPALYFIKHIISGETDINTDMNNNGIFDALENTVYDYKECFVPEDDEEPIQPIEWEKDSDDDEEFDDSSFNDETIDQENYISKKDSGCTLTSI